MAVIESNKIEPTEHQTCYLCGSAVLVHASRKFFLQKDGNQSLVYCHEPCYAEWKKKNG